MLFRMYARWAERKRFKVEVIEETAGEEAELNPARSWSRATTPMVGQKQNWGFTGWCVSRPLTANARRHTSFASVWVYPVIDDRIDIRDQ